MTDDGTTPTKGRMNEQPRHEDACTRTSSLVSSTVSSSSVAVVVARATTELPVAATATTATTTTIAAAAWSPALPPFIIGSVGDDSVYQPLTRCIRNSSGENSGCGVAEPLTLVPTAKPRIFSSSNNNNNNSSSFIDPIVQHKQLGRRHHSNNDNNNNCNNEPNNNETTPMTTNTITTPPFYDDDDDDQHHHHSNNINKTLLRKYKEELTPHQRSMTTTTTGTTSLSHRSSSSGGTSSRQNTTVVTPLPPPPGKNEVPEQQQPPSSLELDKEEQEVEAKELRKSLSTRKSSTTNDDDDYHRRRRLLRQLDQTTIPSRAKESTAMIREWFVRATMARPTMAGTASRSSTGGANADGVSAGLFPPPEQRLLFVEGPSGAGKTRLVRHSLPPIATRCSSSSSSGYLLLVAKFDALLPPHKSEPYTALCGALNQLIAQIVQQPTVVEAVRTALGETTDHDDTTTTTSHPTEWQVLVEMIPLLRQIVGGDSTSRVRRGSSLKKNNKTTTTKTSATIATTNQGWREEDDDDPPGSTSFRQRQPSLSSSGGSGGALMKRFSYVFLLLLRAITSSLVDNNVVTESSSPVVVVLWLDDLHWADSCSRQVVSDLLVDLVNCPSLLVVVTWDNNHNNNNNITTNTITGNGDTNKKHISPDSNGASVQQDVLDKIMRGYTGGGQTTAVTQITVDNLRRNDVEQFICAALEGQCLVSTISDMARLVYEQTQGHVLYVLEFIKHLLNSQRLVYCDNDDDSSAGFWRLDVPTKPEAASLLTTTTTTTTLSSCNGSNDIILSDFLLRYKLAAMSPQLRHFVQVAACTGSTNVPVDLLQHCLVFANDDDKKQTFPLLVQEALSIGLLTQDDHGTKIPSYAFSHDIIQQVVYQQMIPNDEERERMHLRIGRSLRQSIQAKDLERTIFVLMAQFNLAKRWVTTDTERYDLAHLCLWAGRKAAASSTFRIACVYLDLGIEFLGGDRGWRDCYSLSLALYNAAAEMHLCVTDFAATERLLNVVLQQARPLDRLQSETTRIYATGMSNRLNEAIDLGIQLLARLGETFPRRRWAVLYQAARLRNQINDKSDEQLLCLPTMKDPEKLACIQVLNHLYLHTVFARPRLTPLVALKFASLTLKHGQCLVSPVAFAAYGMVLGHIGHYDEAFRFGQLGVKMLERSGHDEFVPRVYAAFYGAVYILRRPMPDAIVKLHEGYRMGLQTGDYEYACLNANLYLYLTLYAFAPLPTIDGEYASMASVMAALGQKTQLRFSKPCVQSIHHFMGITDDPLSAKGDVIDYDEAYEWCMHTKQRNFASGIMIHRLILMCVFNDFSSAYRYSQETKCLGAIAHVPLVFFQVLSMLCLAITHLEHAFTNSNNIGGQQPKPKAAVLKHARRTSFDVARRAASLLNRLSLSCPYNFAPMRLLLDAEVAAAKGRDSVAFELYTWSINCAKGKFLMLEALGNERCGRFLYRQRQLSAPLLQRRFEDSKSFLEEACRAYKRWGAMAKVVRLQEEILSLFSTKAV